MGFPNISLQKRDKEQSLITLAYVLGDLNSDPAFSVASSLLLCSCPSLLKEELTIIFLIDMLEIGFLTLLKCSSTMGLSSAGISLDKCSYYV